MKFWSYYNFLAGIQQKKITVEMSEFQRLSLNVFKWILITYLG